MNHEKIPKRRPDTYPALRRESGCRRDNGRKDRRQAGVPPTADRTPIGNGSDTNRTLNGYRAEGNRRKTQTQIKKSSKPDRKKTGFNL
jgi:hypothetical protein